MRFWKRPKPSLSETPCSSSVSVKEHSENAVLILRIPLKSNVFSLQGEESKLGQPSLPPTRSPAGLLSRHKLILVRGTLLLSHSEIFARTLVGETPATERVRERVCLWSLLEEVPTESVFKLRRLRFSPSSRKRSFWMPWLSWHTVVWALKIESLFSRQLMLLDLVRRPWDSVSPVKDAPLHRLAVLLIQPARTKNLPSVLTYLLCFLEFLPSLRGGCWLCPWQEDTTGQGDAGWHLKQTERWQMRIN